MSPEPTDLAVEQLASLTPGRLTACGWFVAGDHDQRDDSCVACVEARSTAPEWMS